MMVVRKISFKEILFWVFLIIGVIMVLWRVFGNSPTDLQVVAPFIVMTLMKVWAVSDRQIKFEMKTRGGFSRMKEDLNLIKEKLGV